VGAPTLRAWEQRYGLLSPERSGGNYRLYTAGDEARVRAMLVQMGRGLSTAEAARTVLADESRPGIGDVGLDGLERELLEQLERFDERAAHASLDRLFALVSVERALREVMLPVLHAIGERWAHNEIGVAEEHFATSVLQARLLSVASGWQTGPGPPAVLACAPRELHSIALACLGLGLRSRGWTVFYLGQDTPVAAMERIAQHVHPRVVVISAALPERLVELAEDPPMFPDDVAVVVAGRGASEPAAAKLGARLLDTDPLTAAELLTRDLR